MVAKSRKKRGTKAQKSPLMLFLLIFILLAVLSAVIGYFILQEDKGEEAVAIETTSETQQEEEPIITIEPPYTGTWVSNYDGAILTLNRFSYTIEMPSVDQNAAIKGELSVVKNVLTFVNASESKTCAGEEGHYQYTFEDNGELFLKLIKDNCKSRTERMETSWFRL